MKATIYCDYRDYYWHAKCHFGDTDFETESRSHGSASQAAQDLFHQIWSAAGAVDFVPVSMRRIKPKMYEIST